MKTSCFFLQLFFLGGSLCRRERQSEPLAPPSGFNLPLTLGAQLGSRIPVDVRTLPEKLRSTKGIKKTSTKEDLKAILAETSVLGKSLRITRKASSRAKELERVAVAALQEQSHMFPLPLF